MVGSCRRGRMSQGPARYEILEGARDARSRDAKGHAGPGGRRDRSRPRQGRQLRRHAQPRRRVAAPAQGDAAGGAIGNGRPDREGRAGPGETRTGAQGGGGRHRQGHGHDVRAGGRGEPADAQHPDLQRVLQYRPRARHGLRTRDQAAQPVRGRCVPGEDDVVVVGVQGRPGGSVRRVRPGDRSRGHGKDR